MKKTKKITLNDLVNMIDSMDQREVIAKVRDMSAGDQYDLFMEVFTALGPEGFAKLVGSSSRRKGAPAKKASGAKKAAAKKTVKKAPAKPKKPAAKKAVKMNKTKAAASKAGKSAVPAKTAAKVKKATKSGAR